MKWESSTSYDLALEYVLLDNRLRGSIEVFHRGSDNLLWSVSISESTGHATQTVNAGSMWNRGVEFDMTGVVFRKKDFLLELNLNATHYKNKITYMPEDPYTTGIRRREVGHSYYDLYLRQWMGVDSDTGNSLYLMDDVYMDTSESKVEKDGVVYTTNVNEAKRDWSGNTLAKVYGGFGTKLRYKNFDMTTTFYYQFGGKLYDYGYYTYMSISSNFTNVHQDLMNHWREPGDITSVPRLSYSTSDTSNLNAATSTRWLVANNLRTPGAGFATDTNVVTVLTPGTDAESPVIEHWDRMGKGALAQRLLDRLAAIPGTVPPLGSVPSGCPFHPRCSQALDICRESLPPETVRNGHRVLCWPVAQQEA